MSKKVKIGLIGAGNIANTHLDSYRHVPDAEIYAICDINADRLKETADKYGIERRFDSVDAMLAAVGSELDAADVCVWNCNHASCAIKALDAGLNVLCEKPMAYNTEQAIAMKEAAERNGKLLMIGFVLRFADGTKIAKDFVDNGYVGDIYYARAQYIRRHGAPGGWFCDKEKSGGGPVIDLGVHVIDQTRFLMGKPMPVSVFATVQTKLGKRDDLKTDVGWKPKDAKDSDPCTTEDFGSALIRFDNGATVLLETTYSLNGPEGGLDLTDGVKLYTECNKFLADVNIHTANYKNSGDMFVEEMAHFVDCVANGTECRATAEDGIIVMKILDAIYESGRTGHEVIIK